MPVYASTVVLGAVTAIYRGDQFILWNAETPTPGTGLAAASVEVALAVSPTGGARPFAIDGIFSGAPGVFEIDVQAAATDLDSNYQTVQNGAITSVDATNNTFHFDAPTVTAKFVRLLMRSRANSVTITARITG